MKRDKALILEILRCLRETDLGASVVPDCAGYSRHQVHYHLELCQEAGFLRRQGSTLMDDGTRYLLTWAGHEILEAHCDG